MALNNSAWWLTDQDSPNESQSQKATKRPSENNDGPPEKEVRLELVDDEIELIDVKPSQAELQWLQRCNDLKDRVRSICEEEGREYTETTNQDEILRQYREAAKIRNQRNDRLFHTIGLTKNVDLCFVIDATYSMDPYIDGTKNAINEIVTSLLNGKRGTVKRLRLAFVAYRDYDCNPLYEILDFTESVDAFREFTAKIVTKCGGDYCEDVLGGLSSALKCSWDENSGTKLVFHIGDAPCHGTDFHDFDVHSNNDHFPDGDKFGLTHTGIFEQFQQKGIQYHFGKITDYTDKMIGKFQEVSKEAIMTFDIKNVEMICDSVVTAVQESVILTSTRAKNANLQQAAPLKEIDFVLDNTEPQWSEIEAVEGVYISYEFPNSITDIINDVPLKRTESKKIKIKIAPQPFARGSERFAFYAHELIRQQPMIFSIFSRNGSFKNVVLKEYATVHPRNMSKRFEISNQVQTIAAFLARQFTDELRIKADLNVQLEFLSIKTLSIKLENGDYRFMSYEERFANKEKFIRFTNNVDYAIMEGKAREYKIDMDFVELLTAFSHWTYKATNKKLMVVDLQGILTKHDNGKPRTVLTDPAIHCVDAARFGQTNLSKQGMQEFFKNHQCNKFCEVLDLPKNNLKA